MVVITRFLVFCPVGLLGVQAIVQHPVKPRPSDLALNGRGANASAEALFHSMTALANDSQGRSILGALAKTLVVVRESTGQLRTDIGHLASLAHLGKGALDVAAVSRMLLTAWDSAKSPMVTFRTMYGLEGPPSKLPQWDGTSDQTQLFNAALAVFEAVQSEDFMSFIGEALASARSSTTTETEEIAAVADTGVAACQNASSEQTVEHMRQIFNGFLESWKAMVLRLVVLGRNLIGHATPALKEQVEPMRDLLDLGEFVMRNLTLFAGPTSAQTICSTADDILAALTAQSPKLKEGLQIAKFAPVGIEQLRGAIDGMRPDLTNRVIYLFQSLAEYQSFTLDAFIYQTDEILKVTPVLKEKMACSLQKTTDLGAPILTFKSHKSSQSGAASLCSLTWLLPVLMWLAAGSAA